MANTKLASQAATAVLATYELLEHILLFVPAGDYCLLPTVSQAFSDVLGRSKTLQHRLRRPDFPNAVNKEVGSHTVKLDIIDSKNQKLLIRSVKGAEVFALLKDNTHKPALTVLPSGGRAMKVFSGMRPHVSGGGIDPLLVEVDYAQDRQPGLRDSIEELFDSYPALRSEGFGRQRKRDLHDSLAEAMRLVEKVFRNDSRVYGRGQQGSEEEIQARYGPAVVDVGSVGKVEAALLCWRICA